jgi:hypothetical protein
MRRELCILAVICPVISLAGCQTHIHKPATTQVALQPEPAVQFDDDAEPAAALVFAPPVVAPGGDLDLSRESREPTAFLGYEDLIKEYIYVRTDDRWCGDGKGDRYERDAITEKIGTLTR